jgi:hypothetical protein
MKRGFLFALLAGWWIAPSLHAETLAISWTDLCRTAEYRSLSISTAFRGSYKGVCVSMTETTVWLYVPRVKGLVEIQRDDIQKIRLERREHRSLLIWADFALQFLAPTERGPWNVKKAGRVALSVPGRAAVLAVTGPLSAVSLPVCVAKDMRELLQGKFEVEFR